MNQKQRDFLVETINKKATEQINTLDRLLRDLKAPAIYGQSVIASGSARKQTVTVNITKI